MYVFLKGVSKSGLAMVCHPFGVGAIFNEFYDCDKLF